MNIKKILAILMLVFIIPASAVMAMSNRYEEAFSLLNGLGIIETEQSDIQAPITRGEFVDLFVKALNLNGYDSGARPFVDVPRSHEDFESIATAYTYGYATGYGDGLFMPDNNITYEEGMSLVKKALGYTSENSMLQKNSSLRKGITSSGNEISYKDAVILIFNMMNEGRVIYDNNDSYKLEEENTLLYANWDVREIKGQITADSMTSLSSKVGCGRNIIAIDDTEYECHIEGISDLLGSYVRAYIRNVDDSDIIISAVPYRGEIINIKSYELHDAVYANNMLTYNEENSSKTTKLKILPAVTILYNGVFAGSQLEPTVISSIDVGEVVAIDSDDDGYIDILKIYDYEILTAGNYTTDVAMKVYDTYKKKVYINFEKKSESDIISIEIDGREAKSSDIVIGDVLAYYESEGYNGRILKVKINRTVTTGTLETMSDKELKIDGKTFRKNPVVDNSADGYGEVPTLGVLATFKFDFLNQVVLITQEDQPELYVGLLVKAGYDTDTEMFFVKLLTESDSLVTYFADDNFVIDGKRVKDLNGAVNLLNGSKFDNCSAESVAQLVTYKLKNGKISKIFTTNNNGINSPEIDAPFKNRYYKNLGSVFGTAVRDFRVGQGTVVFTVSETVLNSSAAKAEEMFVTKMDILVNGATYNCQAYNVDEMGTAKYLVIIDNIPENYGNTPSMYLVKSNKLISDEEGELRRELVLVSKKIHYTYRTKAGDIDTCSDVKAGDIINVILDPENCIVHMRMVFNVHAPKLLQGFSNATSYQSVRYLVGYIETFCNGWGYLTYDQASSSDITAEPLRDLVNIGAVTCSVFNMTTKTVTDGIGSDFAKYISNDGTDYLVFYYEAYGQPTDLIIYEFE